ncbi:MAG: monovalent cation/H+ antiporter subunit D family protein [Thermodesulfobacteriota bacterium]|nr:MAG: monovalent cation/H+ antiporter subunit D family protein [Thermodesulfobacteriota bacterium]
MEIIHSIKPLLAVSVSLAAVLLIGLSSRRPDIRESWTVLAALAKFIIVASMLPEVLSGKSLAIHLATVAPGLEIKLQADALSLAFAATASFLWIITSFYSIGYMRTLNEHAQTRYFMSFALAMSGAMGVAFSANMFTLFIFYEMITFSTFPLVAHKETPEAIQGARRYLVYLLGTSLAFLLFAMFLTYQAAGTLDFSPGGILDGKASDALIAVIFILFIAGITKAGMMPFHSWLPAAMVAPTPASALLHAVAVVKAGVFTVIKVVLFIFGTDVLSRIGLNEALMYFAAATIVISSIVALKQDNLKRRLAYSTISQLSYIVLAVAILTPGGITGSVMHIVAHAFGKITLFFAAGAIYVAHHKTKVSELDGIGRKMPFTMGAFAVGSLSMIGVPPFAGFISKFYIFTGAIEAGHLVVLAVLAVSTVLNACYLLPIVYAAFFKKPAPAPRDYPLKPDLHEAPTLMLIPLVLTAAATLVLFFYPSVFLELAASVAGAGR